MASYIIEGGKILTGEVKPSGSKNASLPIIAASILSGKVTKLYNVPNIHDIQITLKSSVTGKEEHLETLTEDELIDLVNDLVEKGHSGIRLDPL